MADQLSGRSRTAHQQLVGQNHQKRSTIQHRQRHLQRIGKASRIILLDELQFESVGDGARRVGSLRKGVRLQQMAFDNFFAGSQDDDGEFKAGLTKLGQGVLDERLGSERQQLFGYDPSQG